MGTFCLHGLILCVSEGFLFLLPCIHILGIGSFDLHELILCVFEDYFSGMTCIHIVCIELSSSLVC